MNDALSTVLAGLGNPQRNGTGYRARCPAHDDNNPSLSVSEGDDGRVLLHCHAGCTVEEVVAALGLHMRDLMPRSARPTPRNRAVFGDERDLIAFVQRTVSGTHVHTWTYQYRDGTEALRMARFNRGGGSKEFRPFHRSGDGWKLGDPTGKLPLYGAPAVVTASLVAIFEGEKCADAGRVLLGIVTTTSAHGAKSARKSAWFILAGKHVIIFPDHGSVGQKYCDDVIAELSKINPPPLSVRIVRLPDLSEGEDIVEFTERRGPERARSEIQQMVTDARPIELRPTTPTAPTVSEDRWPGSLGPAAFHGLVGEFVRFVEPHTEADPAALLLQFLTCFGNAIGNSAHQLVEADRHSTNLFVVLVGTTAKGRKGSSLGRVRFVVEAIDTTWRGRIASNLSSGEGLVYAVRDPMRQQNKGAGSRDVEVLDPGEPDKRLLVVESEFGSVLRVIQRETNTLSSIVRQAWDRGDLRNMTKNSPLRATGAHISIIGHITRDEVRRLLKKTEMVNGFCNRFLWVCVRRSKLLPEGGALRDKDFKPLLTRIRAAYAFARSVKQMRRAAEARIQWAEVYPRLSEGRSGMLGAVTSRAEAQVVRLSAIYALLDCSRVIRAEHMRAAFEVWRYCEDSARYTFGTSLGDPLADVILDLLRESPDGLTRTQIRDAFDRHKTAADIQAALDLLRAEGLAEPSEEDSGGRRTERWRANSESTKGGATNAT